MWRHLLRRASSSSSIPFENQNQTAVVPWRRIWSFASYHRVAFVAFRKSGLTHSLLVSTSHNACPYLLAPCTGDVDADMRSIVTVSLQVPGMTVLWRNAASSSSTAFVCARGMELGANRPKAAFLAATFASCFLPSRRARGRGSRRIRIAAYCSHTQFR